MLATQDRSWAKQDQSSIWVLFSWYLFSINVPCYLPHHKNRKCKQIYYPKYATWFLCDATYRIKDVTSIFTHVTLPHLTPITYPEQRASTTILIKRTYQNSTSFLILTNSAASRIASDILFHIFRISRTKQSNSLAMNDTFAD